MDHAIAQWDFPCGGTASVFPDGSAMFFTMIDDYEAHDGTFDGDRQEFVEHFGDSAERYGMDGRPIE